MKTALTLLALPILVLAATACGGDDGPAAAPAAATAPPAAGPSATPAGPVASVEPRAGPPGTEVTVSGAGWPAGTGVSVGTDLPGLNQPYAEGVIAADGSFALRFRIETLPDGSELSVGLLRLRVQAGETVVRVPYSVQSPRPLFPTTPAG